MATPQSTTSDDTPKNNLEQITFRFCSECSNMLYPKEDDESHKLMFTCRTCRYTEEATSSCVFRHVLNSAAGETAGVTQDVGSDPTVCSPVFSHSDLHRVPAASTPTIDTSAATTALRSDPSLAFCLRCGITLLHCARCQDPASVGEYNESILRNPDFTLHQSMRYIQFANYWKSLDQESQAALEGKFTSSCSINVPCSSEETLTQYLPMEMVFDPEADPAESPWCGAFCRRSVRSCLLGVPEITHFYFTSTIPSQVSPTRGLRTLETRHPTDVTLGYQISTES